MKRGSFIGALIVLLASVLPGGAGAAGADDYPSRPITMLVGFPPGGPTDALARIIADGMKNKLGQIDRGRDRQRRQRHHRHRPRRSCCARRLHHRHRQLVEPCRLDRRSTLSITMCSRICSRFRFWRRRRCGFSARKRSPPKTAAELIAWVKSELSPTTFGTVGTGSAAHLCGIYLQQKTGAQFAIRALSGRRPAIQDLIGRPDRSQLPRSNIEPAYVKAGKMKAFAVMSEERWPKSPDTPTMIESGVPGLSISFWHGLWTTKGTPQPVVDRLDAAVQIDARRSRIRQLLESSASDHLSARSAELPTALAAYQQGRDRQMVADHQGGRHQDRIKSVSRRSEDRYSDLHQRRVRARHADRHRGRGDHKRNRERQRREQFDAGASPFGGCFSAIGEAKPTCPVQRSHWCRPCSVFAGPAVRRGKSVVSCCSKECREMPAQLGQTLSKSLRKKGKFVILVNRELTPERVADNIRRAVALPPRCGALKPAPRRVRDEIPSAHGPARLATRSSQARIAGNGVRS